MEGDTFSVNRVIVEVRFLSTPSGWRATDEFFFFVTGSRISIHALRVEGDHRHFVRCFFGILNFYPRPPGGGRLVSAGDGGSVAVFLSTPSGWRATNLVTVNGGDVIFLSTPSGWRATGNAPAGQAGSPISIHALRVEGDSLLTAYSKDT